MITSRCPDKRRFPDPVEVQQEAAHSHRWLRPSRPGRTQRWPGPGLPARPVSDLARLLFLDCPEFGASLRCQSCRWQPRTRRSSFGESGKIK